MCTILGPETIDKARALGWADTPYVVVEAVDNVPAVIARFATIHAARQFCTNFADAGAVRLPDRDVWRYGFNGVHFKLGIIRES